MTNEEIKETLEKQLQLLSERAKTAPDPLLIELSHQMVEIARLLMDAQTEQHPGKFLSGLQFGSKHPRTYRRFVQAFPRLGFGCAPKAKPEPQWSFEEKMTT